MFLHPILSRPRRIGAAIPAAALTGWLPDTSFPRKWSALTGSAPVLDVLGSVGAGVLSANPDGIVFPGSRNKPLSDMTIAKALKTAGHGEYTVHGFRSSFRDRAAEMTGTPGDVVEAALAHTVANRVEAAYRRTNSLEKRRVLMEAWGGILR